MNLKLIFAFLLFGGVVSGATWIVAMSSASATAAASATPSADANATAISRDPELCPKVEAELVVPTDEEATAAFRARPNTLSYSNEEPKHVVKLGSYYKGTMSLVQCGADIDFGGNGQFQQRSIGFDKTPSGWTAVLF